MNSKLTNFLKKLDYRYYIGLRPKGPLGPVGIFVVAILIVGGAIYILRAPKTTEASWWNDSWYYRQQFDVYNNESSDLTDYQVAISTSTLQLASLNSAGKTNSDFSDLRFTDANGNLLDYWFEEDTDNIYRVYVRFSNLPASATSTMFMYYGNQSASDERNGNAVFEFFDDFENQDWNEELSHDSPAYTVVDRSGSEYYNGGYSYKLSNIGQAVVFPEEVWSSATLNLNNDLDNSTYELVAHTKITSGGSSAAYLKIQTYASSVWSDRIIDNQISGNAHDWSRQSNIFTSSVEQIRLYSWYSTSAYAQRNSYTDNLFIRKATTIEPIITLTAGASEEQSEAPIAYWSFDEGYGTTAHDNTSNQNHGTLINMTTTGSQSSWVDGKFGKALRFDGDDDYIDAGNSSNFDLTSAITITAWIKTNETPVASFGIVSKDDVDSDRAYNFHIYNSGIIRFYCDGLIDTRVESSQTVNDGNWHHVVAQYDGSYLRLYIDGKKDGEDESTGSINTSSEPLRIGDNGSGKYYNGQIDEVKIYNYALTADQIKKSYNSKAKDFTGMNLSSSQQDAQNRRNRGLVGFWKMDEESWDGTTDEVIDYSGRGNHGTAQNGGTTTSTAKFGMAGEFDGSAKVLATNPVGIAEDGFTISAWMQSTSTAQSQQIVYLGSIQLRDTVFYTQTSDGWQSINFTRPSINNWHYISGTFDGEYMRLYIDGVFINDKYIEKDINNGSTFILGGRGGDLLENFLGQIDHVKIWNRALTPQEISEEYVTGPAPVGYWSMDKIDGTTVIDESGMGNNGIMNAGRTKSNSWVPGKVGQALDFSRSDYNIGLGKSDILQMGEGVITVSQWVKPDIANQTTHAQLFYGNAGGGNYGYGTKVSSSGNFTLEVYGPEGGRQGVNWDVGIVDQEWNHLIAIFDGVNNEMVAYLNGVEKNRTSITDPGNVIALYDFRIGAHSTGAYFFNGQIDEVKIWNYALTPYQIAQEYNGGEPVGYWSFDEGQGTIAHDQSGHDNHGTLMYMTTSGSESDWVDGKFGKALRFDGANDHVVIGDENSLVITNSISVTAWVKLDSFETTSYGHTIYNKGTQGSNNHYWLIYNSDSDKWNWELGSAGNERNRISYSDIPNLNQWYYVVGTYDVDTGYQRLYLDGMEVASEYWGVDTIGGDTSYSPYIGRYGSYFNGTIDEVKIFNYALTPYDIQKEYASSRGKKQTSLNLSKSTQDETNARADGLVGWWKMDEDSWDGTAGEVIDSSGLGNHGTSTCDGACSIPTTTSTAKYGRAGEFDGVDDMVRIEDNNDELNSDSVMTLSAWVKSDGVTAYDYLVSKGTSVRNYHLYTGSNSEIYFFINDGDSTLLSPSGGDIWDDQWHHVVGLTDGEKIRIFVDGDEVGNGTSYNGTINRYSTSLLIGAYPDPGTPRVFPGEIDDVKIWNRALSSEEIEQEYHNVLAPVGYWSMDQIDGTTVIDQSGMGNDGTLNNMSKSDNWKPGKVGQSLEFDGTEEYVETIDLSWTINESFTISAWIKEEGNTSGISHNIISKDGYEYSFFIQEENLRFMYWDSSGSGNILLFTDYTDYKNEWHYVTVVYDANNNNSYLYIDGVEKDTDTTSGNFKDNSDSLLIGSGYPWNGASNTHFNGQIDEVKVYNYAFTPYQIAQEYNGGKPVAYWSFDEGEGSTAHDNTPNRNDGTLYLGTGGNTSTSTAWQSSANCKKGSCMDFDGTDDYVEVDMNFNPTDNNFSTSFWMKADDVTANKHMFGLGRLFTEDGVWLFKVNAGNLVLQYKDDGSRTETIKSISTGNWYHVVSTYDVSSNSYSIYVNGVKELNDTTNGLVDAAVDVYIGALRPDATHYTFDGKIDEVKIYNYALTEEDIKEDYNLGKGIYFK